MKIESLSPGQIVYDLHKHQMGNTTMRTWGVWTVRVESVNLEAGTVEASWNNNRVETYYKGVWSKWRKDKPVMVKSGFGQRPANRAELKAMKEAKP